MTTARPTPAPRHVPIDDVAKMLAAGASQAWREPEGSAAAQGARVPARRIEPGSASRQRPTIEAAADGDGVLIERTARRDAGAFRQLVERHLPVLLAVGRRMLRDDAEAEDVVQEAMLRLWQSAASLEVGPDGARPWLRRVVSNLCIDRIRAGRRWRVTDEVPDQPQGPPQLDGLIDGDLARRVEQAVQALPDRQRLALTLFHHEGRSQVEIGQALGVSDEAVESLLARARRALRSSLQSEWRELLQEER